VTAWNQQGAALAAARFRVPVALAPGVASFNVTDAAGAPPTANRPAIESSRSATDSRAPAGVDGASALPILRGTAAEIRAATLIEGGVARAQSTTPRGAIIQPPWALLRQDMGCGPGQPAGHRPPGEPFTCLYDLAADPGQTRNLALERPEVIAALSAGWEAYRAKHGKEGAQLQLDPTLVDALRRTGYDFRSAPGAQP
jgi:hypothetical protein